MNDSHPTVLGMAKHTTPTTRHMKLTAVSSHINSQHRRGGLWHCAWLHRGLHSGTEWTIQAGAVGSRLSKKAMCPLSPMGSCDWLLTIIPKVGREEKPALQQWSGTVSGPFDKGCSASRHYTQEHSGERNLRLGCFETFLVLDVKAEHTIINWRLFIIPLWDCWPFCLSKFFIFLKKKCVCVCVCVCVKVRNPDYFCVC